MRLASTAARFGHARHQQRPSGTQSLECMLDFAEAPPGSRPVGRPVLNGRQAPLGPGTREELGDQSGLPRHIDVDVPCGKLYVLLLQSRVSSRSFTASPQKVTQQRVVHMSSVVLHHQVEVMRREPLIYPRPEGLAPRAPKIAPPLVAGPGETLDDGV